MREQVERTPRDLRLTDEKTLEADFRAAAADVYRLVFAPLRPALGQAKLVYLAADGELNRLPFEALPDAAFPHSLGVHSGPPSRVEIAFEPAVADYVRAREWHPSQQLRDTETGGVSMTLDVCLDRALQSWILSFGPFARVIAPESLARDIAGQLTEAKARYAS